MKTIKILTIAPTCFGSRRNHLQGAVSCLAKTTNMILCARRYWRDQWHSGITACCASVMYTVEKGTREFLPLPCTARLHNRLICRHNIDHVINDERNTIIIVVLAKHEVAPWWWSLREPHVGAIVGILIVLTFLWFYNCVHQFGTIKKCFVTTIWYIC